MPEPPVQPPPDRPPAPRPARSRLGRLVGIVAVMLALGIAGFGIVSRQRDHSALARWTQARQTPTVALVTPTPDITPRSITLPGDIEAFQTAPIHARVNGYLKSWSTDIGDRVKAGQTLAVIDAPELDQQFDQAKADLTKADAAANLARTTAKRWGALLSSQAVSVQSADEKSGDAATTAAAVRAAQANEERLAAMMAFKRLVAPFDGVVTARRTDVGALIGAGGTSDATALFDVADTHAMRVYVRVPQAYATAIMPSLAATMALPQFPGRSFAATVATTANAIDPRSRTVLVELHADNPDGALWPGTFARVTFTVPGAADILEIPTSALIFQRHGAQVATLDAEGRVRLKRVAVGEDFGTRLQILSGLAAQDRVIDSPPDFLNDGDTVRLADNAPAPPQAAPQTAPAPR